MGKSDQLSCILANSFSHFLQEGFALYFFFILILTAEKLRNTQFLNRRAAFSSQLKSKVGNILTKAAEQRITLNIDGTPITSKSHTHPSHSQTSRLFTSSLSLGVPVPRGTQCM